MASYGGAYGSPVGRSRPGVSPVYQIDFTAVACGKRIVSTKRRVRWRFGFTNEDALAAGETGTACRGEEHDITVVWSITSGKRLVLADGQEVHYSNSRSSVLEFSWTMRGNHVLKVVCHASPPMNATPGFRQYDFFVDGQSFFSMPKVYRLGLSGSAVASRGQHADGGTLALATSTRRKAGEYNNYSVNDKNAVSGRSADIAEMETPHNVDEEEAYLAEAIKNSLVESKKPTEAAPAPAQENLLLDFFSEPAAPAAAPVPVQQQPALPPAAPMQATQQNFSSAPQPSYNDIANQFMTPAPPVAAPSDMGFATAPPHEPVTAYANPFAATTMTAPQPAPAAPMALQQTPVPPTSPVPTSPVPTPAVPQVNAAPTSPVAAATSAPEPMGNVFAPAPAKKGLGTDANAAYENFAKMDSFKLVSKHSPGRSNPFEVPKAPAPSLSNMKAMSAQQNEKKPVMNAPPPPAAGAMVLSGSQQGNWSGYGGQQQMGAQPMSMGTMNQGMYAQQQPQYSNYGVPPAAGGYQMQGQQQQYYQQQAQYGQYQQQPPPQQNGQYYGQQY